MARTNLTPTQLVATAGVDIASAPVTIDATLVTNGVRLVGAGSGSGTIVLRVANTAGGAKKVTVQKGDGPAAGGSKLEVSVALTSGVKMIALNESAGFENLDESYSIDFESGFTGTIAAFRVPS